MKEKYRELETETRLEFNRALEAVREGKIDFIDARGLDLSAEQLLVLHKLEKEVSGLKVMLSDEDIKEKRELTSDRSRIKSRYVYIAPDLNKDRKKKEEERLKKKEEAKRLKEKQKKEKEVALKEENPHTQFRNGYGLDDKLDRAQIQMVKDIMNLQTVSQRKS